jgi:DNA polymerase-3 subunit gamma/tau
MLAFRPADLDGGPGPTLKPSGVSQATADSASATVAGARGMPAAVEAPVPVAAAAAVPERAESSPRIDAPVAEPAVVAQPSPAVAPQEPAAAPSPEPTPPVDLPWDNAAAAADVPPAAAQSPVSVPPVMHPAAPQPEPLAAVPDVQPASEDDEPPPGDYDYDETGAESLDYDFDAGITSGTAEPEPLPAAKPATGLAAEWLELFPRLGISGLTGSIGANCSLVARDGEHWTLHLDPAHSALFNPTQQRRLSDALEQHLGHPLQLQVEIRTPEQETPAQAAARQRAERQRQAVASIQADPLVQQMIQQFAAVIREDSIEPLNT